MASGVYIDGLGNLSDPVKFAPGASLNNVVLSPEEGCVLSRIDGATCPTDVLLIDGGILLVADPCGRRVHMVLVDRAPGASPAPPS